VRKIMTDKKETQIQTAIRLPASLLKRIDRLAENMSKTGIRITRAEALRLAAATGVSALETKRGMKP
jgi:predicted DNA-binding protein